VLDGQAPRSPEAAARLGEAAMAVVNEHPNVNIRKLYAGQVATQVGLPVADLVAVAERRTRRPQIHTRPPKRGPERRENAEFVAIALLVQSWDAIAPWLVEALFADEVYRRAFVAIAQAGGDLVQAIALADPEARDVLERAAVVDVGVESTEDVEAEARNLITAAIRRELANGAVTGDPDQILSDAEARVQMEDLRNAERGLETAGWLLGWLEGRTEARTGGV
jgi:DNA primase